MTSNKKRPTVLSLKIPDKQALYMAYMPYLKRRGIFIAGDKNLKIGDEVFLILDLWCEHEKVNVAGSVAWITPNNAQNSKKQGFGIHFNESLSQQVSSQIERILGNSINSKHTTSTM